MALAKRGLSFIFFLQNGRGKWTSACRIKQFSSITNLEGSNLTAPTPSYLYASDSNIEQIMIKDMLIYEDFITKEEEMCILEEVEPYMKRLRYEYAHWDNVSLENSTKNVLTQVMLILTYTMHACKSVGSELTDSDVQSLIFIFFAIYYMNEH